MQVMQPQTDFIVDSFPAQQRSLRIACVTETYPPEVNGVAGTVARIVTGLQGRNHTVQLIRLRQKLEAGKGTSKGARDNEVLMRGLPTREVSEALAVSDPRSFVRAFARWTGQSPAAWRKARGA